MDIQHKSRRSNGRLVVAGLLVLCLAGFFATVWNYSRTHALTSQAAVQSNGNPSFLHAQFKPGSSIQAGQRVVVKIPDDPRPSRGGRIIHLSPEGLALIETDSPVTSAPGSKATVSIDGTVGPRPVPQ
jgi:hypothetical protein